MGKNFIIGIIMVIVCLFIGGQVFGRDTIKHSGNLMAFWENVGFKETNVKRVISTSLPRGLNENLTGALIRIESERNLNAIRFEKDIWTGDNPIGNCNEIGWGSVEVPASFQEAERINQERAYCSSSFGKYQIPASDIKEIGEYETYSEIKDKFLNNGEEQDKTFLSFVKKNKHLNNVFKKILINDEDFPIVAEHYDGEEFCEADTEIKYDEKLARAYGKKNYKSIC